MTTIEFKYKDLQVIFSSKEISIIGKTFTYKKLRDSYDNSKSIENILDRQTEIIGKCIKLCKDIEEVICEQ